MRICRITSAFPPPWEGLKPGPYELSLAQVKSGHQITVITKYSEGCETFDKEVPFTIFRIKTKKDLVFSFFATLKFIQLHVKNKYNVVHNHGVSAVVLLIFKRFFLIKVPVISSVHIVRKSQYKTIQKADIYKVPRETLGNEAIDILPTNKENRRELLMEKLYLKLSDGLAAVSEGLRKGIKNEYSISDKVYVILNGVNIDRFRKSNRSGNEYIKLKHGIDCKYLILFVGVLNGRKGEFDLIKAMSNIISEYPDTKLLIIGEGPTKEVAMTMVKNLKLEDSVKFISNVTHNEINKYYMACDLFVLPSCSEGLPKVLLEAMACGTPVVVSDIPGHREIITDNVTGYLFKIGDIDDLKSTILRVLENADQRKIIASNAKTLVEKLYTWEAVAKRLDYVYETVMDSEFEENRNTKRGKN